MTLQNFQVRRFTYKFDDSWIVSLVPNVLWITALTTQWLLSSALGCHCPVTVSPSWHASVLTSDPCPLKVHVSQKSPFTWLLRIETWAAVHSFMAWIPFVSKFIKTYQALNCFYDRSRPNHSYLSSGWVLLDPWVTTLWCVLGELNNSFTGVA